MYIARPEQLIGIAGGSCSGKTTLETNLSTRLRERLALFPFDDMFVGMPALEGRIIDDWEDPVLYRWEDYRQHIKDLKNGIAVTVVANSRESAEAGISSRLIEPKPFVVVAGFLALYDVAITPLFDKKIYLDLPEEEIIRRRLARAKPNHPWDSMDYINQSLIPGHREVVVPQRELADYVIDAMLAPSELADEVIKIIEPT